MKKCFSCHGDMATALAPLENIGKINNELFECPHCRNMFCSYCTIKSTYSFENGEIKSKKEFKNPICIRCYDKLHHIIGA